MTKKQLADAVEKLVEALAAKHGASVVDKAAVVGGKVTTVRAAEGGFFDLNACRRLLAASLAAHQETLLATALPTAG